jgi:beta-N-acetylhexosaminidase
MSSTAQRLIVGLEKPYLDKATEKLLAEKQVGGLIFFDRNCENLVQLSELADQIRGCCDDIPFLAIDFEGGRVRRGAGCFSNLEPAAYYVEACLSRLHDDCIKVAQEFGDIGINVNFAPVADLTYEPLNPALAQRTFSSDSMAVADYCRTFIEAFAQYGILCCLKHFPGLGSAANDPHGQMAISCLPAERLAGYDWVPYKAGFEAGAAMVMTTHMLATSIDEMPATFSETTTNLVRAMRFDGIIITDDMTMGAVVGDDLPDKVLRPLVAGHDMVLVCHKFERYEEIIDYLDSHLDELNQHGHKQALKRINDAKKKLA